MPENFFLNNVNEKLAKIRELCPGMHEDLYVVTEYMSKIASDEVDPLGLTIFLNCVIHDVKYEKIKIDILDDLDAFEYFSKNRNRVLTQIQYFPQIIDKIASPEFAKEFRILCQKIFDFNPPKKIKGYPKYVVMAADWWFEKITAESEKEFSAEEKSLFVRVLSDEIKKDMDKYEICNLYTNCEAIEKARNAINLDKTIGYQIYMIISKSKIIVSIGYNCKDHVTVWED